MLAVHPTPLAGACVIDLDYRPDHRGALVKAFDRGQFAEMDMDFEPVQTYLSRTSEAGTLRGFHYQVAPYPDSKLTYCTRGSLFEAIIDLRPESRTYKAWLGFTFRAQEPKALLVPPYVAHAVLTLEDETEYLSFSDVSYWPACERGVRYDDAQFHVAWPIQVTAISEKDRAWEDFDDGSR